MTLTIEGFAAGYAREGVLPISRRARAAVLALEHAPDGRLILEAGRREGKRASREAAHKRLYKRHSKELGLALLTVLDRLDLGALPQQLVDHATQQAAAGATPAVRRRAVAGLALTAIGAQVHAEDRQALDTLNAAGWAHATAYGTGEAQASPARGGPPDPAKVAAGAAVALKEISTSDALSASTGWTDLELKSIAMGAAMAAGDGSALGDATRAVKKALVDSGAADGTYTDQLHAAVNKAFLAQSTAANPGALFDYCTDGNPCDDCIENELEFQGVPEADCPEIPVHPNCLCGLELSTLTPAMASED